MLDQAIAGYVKNGWSVESRTENQATMSRKAKIGWFFNILLSVLTGGLWLLVVAFKLINRKIERKVLTVTESGRLVTA